MAAAYLEYGTSRIRYTHFGSGPSYIVALHGYGESSDSFSFLADSVSADYHLIAVDMPFHGLTRWKEERAFTCRDYTSILQHILASIGAGDARFILLGYSMGGRLAMSILQYMPGRIIRILLLAPDGMKVNSWYWLATQTWAGNRLFLFTMKNPTWFFALLRFANRLNLVNKSVNKFLSYYIEDHKVRTQLYYRWTCMRTFKPDLAKIGALVVEKQLPVRMLYGKHDRIILSTRAGHFHKKLQPFCELHIIDAGHNLLQAKFAATITSLLTI